MAQRSDALLPRVLNLLFVAFMATVVTVSLYAGRREESTEDYFLAGRSLPWWAIGASLIAANISAEQIIGMSGSAYLMGVAIASYEWMAALTLIIVAKYLLPVFLKHKIYTMPQFLEQRFDHRVRMVMATFWLGVYVFVNLTSILWLGSLAINSVTGLDQTYGLVILGLFAISYSLYGGLKAVALTVAVDKVAASGGYMMACIGTKSHILSAIHRMYRADSFRAFSKGSARRFTTRGQAGLRR